MPNPFKPLVTVSALALFVPGAALAEVSAVDIWNNWQFYLESFGYEISVDRQSVQNNTLRLEGLRFTAPIPEISAVFSIDRLEFRERGDGTVDISLSPDIPISVSGTSETGESIDIAAIVRQSGLSMVASGDASDITYDYLARELSLEFDKFIVDGEAIQPLATAQFLGVNGRQNLAGEGDKWALEADTRIDTIKLDIGFDDPENGNKVQIDATVNDLETRSFARMPLDIDPEDPSWLTEPDTVNRADIKVGASAMTIRAEGADAFTLAAESASGRMNFDMSDGRIVFGGGSTDARYSFSSPQLPFPPVNISLGEAAYEFAGPIAPTDEPVDFRLLVKLTELGVDDFLWQMFDAGNVLPHDPATLSIDVSGKARMPVDVFDPATAQMADAPEPELNEMVINEIYLSVAGAEVDGSGKFTFDNTDTDTFDGMPAPNGSVNFDLFGINTLLDNLGTMNLLAQDQAMGARMMLGLFARPADGDDRMTSKVEVRPDGSVFANGQQLR